MSYEGGGVLSIWIKGVPKIISFVSSDWKLTVDNELQKQRSYLNFVVEGKKIELEYREYKFVCRF